LGTCTHHPLADNELCLLSTPNFKNCL